MVKFQVHAAAHKLKLQHGPSPSGTGNGHLHRVRAKFGVTGDQRVVAAQQHGLVAMMQGLNFEDGIGRKIFQENSTLNLRANDDAVDFVAQIRVRRKHVRVQELQKLPAQPGFTLEAASPQGVYRSFRTLVRISGRPTVSRGTKVVADETDHCASYTAQLQCPPATLTTVPFGPTNSAPPPAKAPTALNFSSAFFPGLTRVGIPGTRKSKIKLGFTAKTASS